MKALVLPAPQAALEIRDVDVPRPSAGQVLVKVEACGICHSDVFLAASPRLPKTPLILGHEAVGRVTAIGGGVTRWKPGDRVGVAFLHGSCGACEFCAKGQENYCTSPRQTGYHVDGALAEYVVADSGFVATVPESMAAQQAAPLCCAGLTAYKALRTANVAAGEWVVLLGAGGLGHLAIQLAKQMGLRVAVVDIAADKLELAASLGADRVINGITDVPRGFASAAITFTGAHAAVEQGFLSLRPNGILVLVGLCPKRFELPVLQTVLQGLRIAGILVGTPRDLQEIIDLAANSGIPKVHAESCRLADAPAMMERMKQGAVAGRMVVEF